MTVRADQVGSLLRPPELLKARGGQAKGEISLDALREMEDRAIRDVLHMQRQVGIDIVTDGELRRSSWLGDMAEAVDGFVSDNVMMEWRGPGGGLEPSVSFVVGARLNQKRRLTEHEVGYLQSHAGTRFKMTLPSPSVFMLAAFKPGLTDRFYATRLDLLTELTSIVRREVEALLKEGVTYIQMDVPQYAWYLDEQVRARLWESGVDTETAVKDAVAADNACVKGFRREGVVLALHVCRGNSRSRWFGEGSYEPIAEQLFGGVDVDRFLLEYDTARAGSFAPLRFMPKGKMVVLGLVSTKEARLESVDELRGRIDEASRYVPLENLAVSPQCGFASVAGGNLLSMDDQRRKLELVVETARKVWG